jgi:hypothetical protein
MDSLISPIRHVSREICLFQVSGFLEGPYVQNCPKVAPSSIPHNSQLPPFPEMSLSSLESGRGELPLAHHLNPMAPSMDKRCP